MKTLIVEDEFTARKLLMRLLEPYGDCDIAVDGQEAIDAFILAMEDGERYNLICLDILMPKMDGQKALKEIRKIEKKRGIRGREGVKIIMTTILGDTHNIMDAFKSQCEGYLVKPVEFDKLNEQLNLLGLLHPYTFQ